MNRPMNKRLADTLDNIVDKEKKKQAIVFEFLPEKSKTKEAHISLLDQIEEQVRELETAIGKETRLTNFVFELQGHNMKSALSQMEAWLQPYLTESKFSDRKFDEMNTRVKAINDTLKKKIESNPITLQQIKQLKDLYDLYKGLLKYESLIDRSLNLSRTHEKLSILREHRPFDLEECSAKTTDIVSKTGELKERVALVSVAMGEQLNGINTKLVELENSIKTIL